MVVVFALSVIFLNHAFLPWRGNDGDTLRVAVALPEGDNSLDIAKQVRAQVGLPGEIDFIQFDRAKGKLSFPLRRPGWEAQVRVDLTTGVATIKQKETGIWDGMVYLHMMPGPHNVAIRGNWFLTKAWGWVSDATVYLICF